MGDTGRAEPGMLQLPARPDSWLWTGSGLSWAAQTQPNGSRGLAKVLSCRDTTTSQRSIPVCWILAAILETPLPSSCSPPSSTQPYHKDQSLRVELMQLGNFKMSIKFLRSMLRLN